MEALTGLRFLAALHVVFYHYGRDLFPGAPAWLENIRASGYVSVSLFFILSGFVLSCTYHQAFAQGQGQKVLGLAPAALVRACPHPVAQEAEFVGRLGAQGAQALADVFVLDFGKRNGGEVWHGNAT